MKKRFKVVFKMAGGTVIKTKEFVNPAGVIYCVTQSVPSEATEVNVEDLETGGIASHEIKCHRLPEHNLEGLKAFLGGV